MDLRSVVLLFGSSFNLLSPWEPLSGKKKALYLDSVFCRLSFFCFCAFFASFSNRSFPSANKASDSCCCSAAWRHHRGQPSLDLPEPRTRSWHSQPIVPVSRRFFLVLPFLCLSRLSPIHCLVASTRPRGVRLLPKGAPSVSRPCFASSRHISGLLVVDFWSRTEAPIFVSPLADQL